MLGYLSLDIIISCSSKLTVLLEPHSRKTVRFSEQIMPADKYPSIFSRQMETIVYTFSCQIEVIHIILCKNSLLEIIWTKSDQIQKTMVPVWSCTNILSSRNVKNAFSHISVEMATSVINSGPDLAQRSHFWCCQKGLYIWPLGTRLVQHTSWSIDHFTVVCLVTWSLNGSEAKGDLVLIQTRHHCFCCVNQVVLMLTRCIYMTKAERRVSKQGHLQACCHSKARSPSR